jgi:glutamate-1-semialdehyde 2,1-aminomutase
LAEARHRVDYHSLPMKQAGPRPSEPVLERSKVLQERAHRIIPGGAHTYAKGDDQYPVNAPGFIVRGDGCRVWDVDGNEFIEFGMGLRAVTLGHAFQPVVEAALEWMRCGNNFTRPAPVEVECAERLLAVIERADMVKFANTGSIATTAAVKLARAYTGRDLVALCGSQFFSIDDWFIGTTPMSAGIPEAVRELSVTFDYNDLASVEAVFDRYPGRIACVVMEAATAVEPEDGFLNKVERLAADNGSLFVLDEMITGFRWHLRGAQHVYDLQPDLSVFGKALGNGFSIAALVGKKEVMELGGLRHGGERVFLLSTTHGAENHSLAAAIATMDVYEREDVVGHLYRHGQALADGINDAAEELGIADYFRVLGRPSNLIYATRDATGAPSQPFRTLFLQETVKRGLLAPSFVISYSHGEEEVERTVEAVRGALAVYRDALEDGVERYLVGRSVQPVFRKYN